MKDRVGVEMNVIDLEQMTRRIRDAAYEVGSLLEMYRDNTAIELNLVSAKYHLYEAARLAGQEAGR